MYATNRLRDRELRKTFQTFNLCVEVVDDHLELPDVHPVEDLPVQFTVADTGKTDLKPKIQLRWKILTSPHNCVR